MRILSIVLLLAACGTSKPLVEPDAGNSGPNSCEACTDSATVFGMSWCSATQTCVDESSTTCDYGLIHGPNCNDTGLAMKSKIPIDCRKDLQVTQKACKDWGQGNPKDVGAGTTNDRYLYGGGFVDAANHRLVVAFSCDVCTQKDSGVMGIDLVTGDRTLLSGAVNDILTGPASVGTGSALLSADDVQLAPNGKWWVLDSKGAAAKIYVVDPATGNRTDLYTQAQFDGTTGICKVAGRVFSVGKEANGSSAVNMVVHADGKIYIQATTNLDASNKSATGIVELSGTTCKVIASYESGAATFNVGTGPMISEPYAWLADWNGKLIANETTYFVHAIEIATGNRTVISSSYSGGLLGTGGNLGQATVAPSKDGAVIFTTGKFSSMTFGGTVAIDPATGNRTTYVPAAGPQRNGSDGAMIPHPTLDGVYLVPELGGVTMYEPITGNSAWLSR